jgi:polyhydroxyalkanoate synthesis regulator phasin
MRYYVTSMAADRRTSRPRPTLPNRGGRKPQTPQQSASTQPDKGGNVALVRGLLVKSALAPLNAVLLTRRHIEEVVEDAVARGRMTRDDAQQMVQSLLQRGAKQTDDFVADVERMLGRNRGLEQRDDDSAPRAGGRPARRQRTSRSTSTAPIPGYDELSAAKVQEKVGGLSAAQLRKLQTYERRHANRKTVLDAIERKLR